MQISVRFFTSLRELVGKREETLSFSEGEKVTIELVLAELRKIYGKTFTDYVYDTQTGQVKSFLQLLVNGRSASTMDRLQTVLKDGDVIAILPPVGGG